MLPQEGVLEGHIDAVEGSDRAMRTVVSLRGCAWPMIARWTLVS